MTQRFWEKIDKSGYCWVWLASTDTKGYGLIGISSGKTKLAHRYSYFLEYGEIPKGQLVLHKCDNPPCVNPDHLFLGSHTDNARDRSAKGRNNRANQKGENCYLSKLTYQQVVEIRKAYHPNKFGIIKKIADKYGITAGYCGKIINNRVWKVEFKHKLVKL